MYSAHSPLFHVQSCWCMAWPMQRMTRHNGLAQDTTKGREKVWMFSCRDFCQKTIVIFYQEPYHADKFKNCTKKFCIGGLCLVCPTINSFEILLAELLCRALKGVQMPSFMNTKTVLILLTNFDHTTHAEFRRLSRNRAIQRILYCSVALWR